MPGLLAEKIAIITGSGRGIGKATAAQFVREGATVIIAEFDHNTGKNCADELGENAIFHKTDVGDEKSVIALFDYVMSEFGNLDILVNNAGILADSTLKKLDSDQFDAVINVNLRGTYLCGKAAADIMIKQGNGVILNAASVVAHHGNFGQTNYVATKAGDGIPSKKLSRQEGSFPELTLNLANLKTTQITYIKQINQPILPSSLSFQKYIMKAGATPKLITSVKESSSLPTLDVPCISLAILPSKPSIIAAIIIAIMDKVNFSSTANLIELKPIQTPTKVKIFGRITLVFLSLTNLKFFLGCSINYFFASKVSPAITFWFTFAKGT